MNDSNIEKILRTIINELTSFRTEVNQKFEALESHINKKVDTLDKKLTKRIDKIGKQLAYLEDDSPTREEVDKLENKVDRHIEKPSHSRV